MSGAAGGDLATDGGHRPCEYLSEAAGCFDNIDTDKEHEFLDQLEAAVDDAHRRISEAMAAALSPGT